MLGITFYLHRHGFFPTDATADTFALMLGLNIVVPIGMVAWRFDAVDRQTSAASEQRPCV